MHNQLLWVHTQPLVELCRRSGCY